jgi:hypothetical protein
VAHRTVRCCHVSACDYAPTVGAGESHWPTGSPDSLVHTGQSLGGDGGPGVVVVRCGAGMCVLGIHHGCCLRRTNGGH